VSVRPNLLQTTTTKRCALYARYSSDHQKDTSIDDQFALLRARAQQLGWTIVAEYADRALTGTRSYDRGDLLRLMDDAKAGNFDVVLTEGLGRVSRNQIDSHTFHQSMEFVDVGVYTLEDNALLDTMHVTLRGLQHSQYIKTLAQNVYRGQVGVVKSGRGVGRPPYGYRIVRSINQVKGIWEKDDEQAPIVLRIFEELAAGKSALAIARDLNAEGTPFPNARYKDRQQQWRQDQILGSRGRKQGIARNPIYRGEYIWGKSKIRRAPDGTPVAKITPESEHVIYQRPDLRIVDDSLWNSVQERLTKSGRLCLSRRRRPRHLLSGLLSCGWCHESYVIGAHDRLRCSGRVERGTCKNRRSVLRLEIETAILNALGGALLRDELIDDYVREYNAAQKRERTELVDISKSSKKRETLLERERQHLVDKIVSGKAEGVVGDYILEEIKKRTVELDRIREQAKTPMLPPLLRDGSEIANRFRAQITTLRENLSGPNADAIQAREAIRALIDKIVITPVGEGNERGSGEVSIEVEGKLAALVGLSENGPVRSVQLCSRTPTQQNLTSRTWHLVTSIRNDPPLAGRHLDRPRILSALKAADSPLTTQQIIEFVVQAAGEEPTRTRLKSRRTRVTNCLEYLYGEGIVTMSNVPVARSRQRQWALAERQGEFWPLGLPMQNGGHIDTVHVFSTLREATALVTSTEIARRVLSTCVPGQPMPPFEDIRLRVRRCLDFHKKHGTVHSIVRPGTKHIGWYLPEREHELCPSGVWEDSFQETSGVFAALKAARVPLRCREIAIHILTAAERTLCKSEIRKFNTRIWACLQSHKKQGTVREIALAGRGGRARGWVLANSSEP
jgi:site-specific DNA recombinase